MPSCPACGRSLAVARATCLYCNTPLAGAVPAAPVETAPAAAAGLARERVLVLLDLAHAAPATLAELLALSAYEASLLTRRGGLHLLRAAAADEAAAEARRLAAGGVVAWVVPEAEVRAPPLVCLAGEPHAGGLLLRTTEGSVTLARGDALLVVRGSITREYQTRTNWRRIATARPELGFRVHVHRRAEARPLEIDALNFELGFAATSSARLEIDARIEAVAGDAPLDDAFSRQPAVLGPAAPEPGSALTAAGSLAGAPRSEAGEGRPLLLDNLAQFRFYSGCLAAVARRRAPGSAPER